MTTGGSALQDFREGLAFVAIKQRVILLLIMTAGCYGFGASASDDVVSCLCKKAVGSGTGRGGLPLVCPGSGAAAHVDALLRFTEWNLSDRIKIICWDECGERRWRSGCSSGRKTSTWSVFS